MFLTPRKFERNFVDAKLYVKKNRTESNLQVKNSSNNKQRLLFYSHEYYVIAQIPKTVTSHSCL